MCTAFVNPTFLNSETHLAPGTLATERWTSIPLPIFPFYPPPCIFPSLRDTLLPTIHDWVPLISLLQLTFTLLLLCFHLYQTSWIEINPNDKVISVIVLYAHFLYLCRDVMCFSMLRSRASVLLTLRMSPWVICSNQDFKLCLAAC